VPDQLLAAKNRHHQVGQDQVRQMLRADEVQRGGAVCGFDDLVASVLEDQSQHEPHPRLIVNYQYCAHPDSTFAFHRTADAWPREGLNPRSFNADLATLLSFGGRT
jgi:hypothetical protein